MTALAIPLKTQAFLLGASLSVADLNVASILMRPRYLSRVREAPYVARWFDHCANRPALQRALREA